MDKVERARAILASEVGNPQLVRALLSGEPLEPGTVHLFTALRAIEAALEPLADREALAIKALKLWATSSIMMEDGVEKSSRLMGMYYGGDVEMAIDATRAALREPSNG